MPQNIDLEELLKKNPNVDRERLQEGLKLAEELRRSRPNARKRTHPLSRRRVTIVDDLESDPRLTQLSRLRKK